MMSGIEIRNVDDLDVPEDKFGISMLFCGSTRSGKTTLLNYMWASHFIRHITVLMSNSLQSGAYGYLKKHTVKSDLYHPELLKEMYQINHATQNHYKFCAILDDLTHIKNDKEYMRLLTIYRNSRICGMISAQGISMFNKTCRGNINFVFLMRMNSDAEIEKVIKEYLISHYPKDMNLSEKITLYRRETEDHWFYAIDNINGKIFRSKLRPEQLIVDD